jgi:hypothetical protein
LIIPIISGEEYKSHLSQKFIEIQNEAKRERRRMTIEVNFSE